MIFRPLPLLALIAPFLVALTAPSPPAGSGWTEDDFKPRPVVGLPFEAEPELSRASTVVGVPKRYTFEKNDTLYDVARHFGLGINEVQDAMPDVEVWLPPEGEARHFPTWWVLPESDHQGVVINIPEMRLFYYPEKGRSAGTVITYAVGLGRDDWQTPVGRFHIREKTKDPTWVIPPGILEERIREKGRHERSIPGGHPENPLGRYRMRLSLPLYGIHGTNIPWGVGMKVSHGCIRLYPEDIESLFPLVPVGTPGEIVYQPVKIGARGGHVYIEVHRAVYDDGFDYWNQARSILRRRGWEESVDWGKLAEAIDRKSGVPTRISGGFGGEGAPRRPAPRPEAPEAGAREADRRAPGGSPSES